MANSTAIDSGEENDNIREVKQKFGEICSTLKIDESVANEGWKEFKNISGNVTLEVNELELTTNYSLCK